MLKTAGFDEFCEERCAKFYQAKVGRPSLAPGVYFHLLLIGFFEGIDSERGIAWRVADSLSLRRFLDYDLNQPTPDHVTVCRTRRLIDSATHQAVFGWALKQVAEHSLPHQAPPNVRELAGEDVSTTVCEMGRCKFGSLNQLLQGFVRPRLIMGGSMLPEKQIRIMTVEDHPVFRGGLEMIISAQPDMLLVAQATNADEALSEYRRLRPDVVLMDQRLPGASGTEALIAIRAQYSDARIMMLTTSQGDIEIQRALRAGAVAYMLKSAQKDELLKSIRAVAGGRKYIPSDVAGAVAEYLGQEDLTPRELEVLKLIRDGNKNKQTADKLAISETTVNFHIKNIVDKLQANDRTHAVTLALRRGLLEI